MHRSQDRTYSPLRLLSKQAVTPTKNNTYSHHSGAFQGSYALAPTYPDETRCSQNAYLHPESTLKRPKAYCPLSRKLIDSQHTNQIIRKGIDYSNSKEFAQFKEILTKIALTEEQIISQMKQVRNNKVYLPKGSKPFANYCLSEANFMASNERDVVKQDEVKAETISFSIDQLSKIEEKDTLCQDYRQGGSKAEIKPYYSHERKRELDDYPLKVNMGSKEWQHPIMIKQEPQQTSQSIIYPQSALSPPHNKILYSDIKPCYIKQQNNDKIVTIREHKLKQSLEKEKITHDYQRKNIRNVIENSWNTKKNKENINYQQKSSKKTAQQTCKTVSDTLEDTFYRGGRETQIKKQKLAERDIYNIDFKLVRPTLQSFPIKNRTLESSYNKRLESQRSQRHFTPVKPRDQEPGIKTKRYLNNSKEHSERSNHSISKSKLSVVSASKRHR